MAIRVGSARGPGRQNRIHVIRSDIRKSSAGSPSGGAGPHAPWATHSSTRSVGDSPPRPARYVPPGKPAVNRSYLPPARILGELPRLDVGERDPAGLPRLRGPNRFPPGSDASLELAPTDTAADARPEKASGGRTDRGPQPTAWIPSPGCRS